jgi:hypothetical protein
MTRPPARTSRLSSTRSLTGASWTAFFEVPADETLHVNVTHREPTKGIRGWAGPGRTSEGFVHNRTFAAAPTAQILRRVRDMVFADPA